MAAKRDAYKCTNCGKVYPKWQGQCTGCKEWSTVEENTSSSSGSSLTIGTKSKSGPTTSKPAQRAKDIDLQSEGKAHKPTGIGELDRVLGGGIVDGAAILLAGPPGVGKSSILATVSSTLSNKENVLYVSGEESIEQITLRHKRMNALGDKLFIAAEADLSKVLWHIDEIEPKLIIVDSLQTIASPDIDGRSGSVSQVTEVGTILTRIAKERNIPVVFVGHYTKDGNVAGPRVVEHLVDVVLAFEGEEDSPLRILRGIKNRFGPADEIGCFEHTEDGLDEVPDPSGMLLGSRTHSIPGVATSIYLEGKRALPVEVQAIVLESQLQNPKKGTAGLDPVRTMMLHAIIQKHSNHSIRLSDKDVYVSTTGGIRVKETAIDLATVVAIASDALSLSSRFDQVCIGEVTLSGEIRRVPGMTRRLSEAQRLGFNAALVPKGTREKLPSSLTRPDSPLKIIEIKDIGHMVNSLRGVQASIENGNLS